MNKGIMDVVNAVLLVEGCTRSGISVRDLIGWNSILAAMEKPSTLFASSMVYRGLSCARKLGADSSEGQKFLRLLWERVEQLKVLMDDADICPSIYCMQTLSSNSAPARSFLAFFAAALDESREAVPSKTLCSAIL
jgi:hypothetical protein